MAFSEFCARSGGSNLNSGTRTGSSTVPGVAADLTYALGNWVAATGVFTVIAADPVADGVAVGDFASVYADGSTVTGFVGRVTARTITTITVSLSAKSGTAPTDGTGTRTLKIGGAWKGPNGAEAFPFGFVTAALTNSAADDIRVNLKNDANYSITAAMSHSVAGPVVFKGFAASYGDAGRATIDGGTTGASYILLTVSNVSQHQYADIKFQNNGATGSATGVVIAGGGANGRTLINRCVFSDLRGRGLEVGSGAGNCVIECEAFGCNQSNTALLAGFHLTSCILAARCISHDNTGSNAIGFAIAHCHLQSCIADSNGSYGFWADATAGMLLIRCDSYNNGSDGLRDNVSGTSILYYIESCNFIKNGGYGINASVTGTTPSGRIVNCGFGSGTQANTSGQTNGLNSIDVAGSITYAANTSPWTDPANGDFRISLAAAKGTGRGTYTQTAASYAGTLGYPDIGAAQSLASGGGVILIEDD